MIMHRDASWRQPEEGQFKRSELEDLLARMGSHSSGKVEIVSRNVSLRGTHPKEIVRFTAGKGKIQEILIKYQTVIDHTGHGHRGGIEYEAKIYRLLESLGIKVPQLLTTVRATDGTVRALILEYLSDALRVAKSLDDRAVPRAVDWIAKLHRMTKGLPPRQQKALRQWNREYFHQWGEKALTMVSEAGLPDSQLQSLVRRYEHKSDILLTDPPSLCHGEYYSINILYENGTVLPVDWESAALGPGVVDLAMLCDGWPASTRNSLVRRYHSSNPISFFKKKLSMARIYVQLRWLGDPGQWSDLQAMRRRIHDLEAIEEEML